MTMNLEMVDVQDSRKNTGRFSRNMWKIPHFNKEKPNMSASKQLDLETLGHPPIMPKIYMDASLSLYVCVFICTNQCLGRFLGIVSQNPRVSKSNWLHVDIFWFSLYNLRYIL